MNDASPTPNVVIENPKIRRGVNVFLGIAGTIVTIATIIDINVTQIDISAYTTPAAGILLGIASVFGLSVTTPNVPKN